MTIAFGKASLAWLVLTYFVASNDAINTSESDILVYEKWVEIDNVLRTSMSSAVKYIMPFAMDIGTNANVSSTCLAQGLQLLNGVKRLETWAVSFVDASGKAIDGTFSSTTSALGDYDQCLNSAASRKVGDREEIRYRGQYCMLQIKPPLPALKREYFKTGIEDLKNYTRSASDLMRLFASKAHFFYVASVQLGICVPSGCSIDDVNNMAKYVSSQAPVNVHAQYCETNTKKPLKTKTIITISVYTVLGLLMLIGTFLDVQFQKKKYLIKNKALRIFAAFSLLKNIKGLLKPETSKDNIACLHGLRFLTITWVIFAHAVFFFTKLFHMHQNMDEVMEATKGFGMQLVSNPFFAVDTFFLIGGLVNCYACVKDEEKKRTRSFFYSIKHRLWRILPVYVAALFLSFILRNFLSGPGVGSSFLNEFERACEAFWWENFLFINNYANFENTCMPHSWYLSAEMQLFLIACVSIRILLRYPKLGLILNLSLVLMSAAFNISWTELHGIHPTFTTTLIDPEHFSKYWNFHTQTMAHAGPYFLGILLGYFLAKKKELEISKVFQLFGWLLAIFMATSVIFVTKKWNSGTEPTKLEDIFYSGFSKIAYSLSSAWIIICCARGHGGYLNKFLSWKAWTPLGRITFCMYLVSPFVQLASLSSSRTLRDATNKEWIWRYFGDYLVSAFIALLFFVLAENPFITVEKILGEKNEQQKTAERINGKESNPKMEVNTISGVDLVSVNICEIK